MTAAAALAAMASVPAGCGGGFHSVGRVTTSDATQVCAKFDNGREQCFPLGLFDGDKAAQPCIRVHFAGESARPLDARFVEC